MGYDCLLPEELLRLRKGTYESAEEAKARAHVLKCPTCFWLYYELSDEEMPEETLH